jgi:hypothetical protein
MTQYNLIAAHHFYTRPQGKNPLRGAIRSTLVAAYHCTMHQTLLQYMQSGQTTIRQWMSELLFSRSDRHHLSPRQLHWSRPSHHCFSSSQLTPSPAFNAAVNHHPHIKPCPTISHTATFFLQVTSTNN